MDRISETTELDANSSGDRDAKRQRQGSISGRLRWVIELSRLFRLLWCCEEGVG